ncbi:MAG: hypothetical protein ACM3PY_18125 [Omnitrophica WOR_2 bacterium]
MDQSNWRTRVLVGGIVLGALVGAGAAYLYLQRSGDNPEDQPKFTTGDGVRLGLLVLGLLRSIAELGEGQK